MNKWLTSVAAVVIATALAACSAGGTQGNTTTSGGSTSGGGTSGGGTTTTTPTAPTVALALSSAAVSSAAPATVAATIDSSAGVALPNVVVTFSVNAAIGTLSSVSALTNSQGVASVTLSPAAASASGADTVTASATVGGLTGSASQGYQVNATTAAIVSLVPSTTDALSSYGQTSLTLTTTGVSVAAPATFNISSACVADGKATISPASIAATTNTTTFTYKDSGGCGASLASDTVTVTIAGTSTSTSAQIALTSPTANSITFDSVSTPNIYLKGSGYNESATVQFKVVDTAGNALPGQSVSLALSTLAGGLLIDQGTKAVTKTSDANGIVSVIINSGTVPTPVRVTATLPSGVHAQSSGLAVVTGLPSQIHFSLSQATVNIEGANHDDAANTYTINVSDRSGNPVPDGTTVIFWAEGGRVTGSALTTGGVVSVPFVSTSPKPNDGRVTVLAYAIGEESFIDESGNGTNIWAAGYPFQDLGDVVKSKQLDGIYDPANDEIVSLSESGAAAGTSACVDNSATYPQFDVNVFTLYDGYTPSRPNTCDGTWSSRTYVRKAVETVFSTSSPNLLWVDKASLPSSCSAISLYPGPTTTTAASAYYPLAGNSAAYVGAATSGSVNIIVADQNTIRLNPMPYSTTVSIAADDATQVTLTMTGGTPVANSSTATIASFSYKFLAGAPSAGATLSTRSPFGTISTEHITLYNTAPPSVCH